MDFIIDIAKQNLDSYTAEIFSCAVLHQLRKDELAKALRNIRKLERDLEDCLYNR